MNGNRALFRLCTFLVIGFVGFLLYANEQGREGLPLRSEGETEDTSGYKIQVGVEEVRIDAVVVDGRGHQIADLTEEDFELYQDGQPQKITSSIYIKDQQSQPLKRINSVQTAKKDSLMPSSFLTQEEVRRTIVFLVDDLSTDFAELRSARLALQKFVETQMRPGDLVAIMQTKGGSVGIQPFSSDKRMLLARIRNMQCSTHSNPNPLPQAMAISYYMRALQDMPGRKILILLSSNVLLPDSLSKSPAFDRLADEALRAGVVIHTLDLMGPINDSYTYVNMKEDPATGLVTGDRLILDAEMNPNEDPQLKKQRPLNSAEKRYLKAQARMMSRPIPLSKKTGGLFTAGNGIGDLEEEMEGYYLISYIPPAGTFSSSKADVFHRIKIRVKRFGGEVHTREGFFGKAEASGKMTRSPDSLMDAMFSPFKHHALTLQLASGYIHDPAKGYILRAWLHLDGQDIGIINEKDGSGSISLDAVAATSDIDGFTRDSGATKIAFHVSRDDVQWIKQNGVRVAISLPARQPGAYYVRAAIKDNASGAIGSAYQFIEIPDLLKKESSLSSIFVLNKEADAAWIQSGFMEESQSQPDTSSKTMRRSQALRRYLPGESIDYMAILYNTPIDNELKPQLMSQWTLFKNGVEILKGSPEPVNVGGAQNHKAIPIRKKLELEKRLQPADYVLQLQVHDSRMQKAKPAVQFLEFAIVDKKSALTDPQVLNKTVMEMTDDELRQFYPNQLGSLEFCASGIRLDDLLKKVGVNVVSFFHDFSNTSAKELVVMSRDYRPGVPRPNYGTVHRVGEYLSPYAIHPDSERQRQVEEYRYLVLRGNSETSWTEERTDGRNRPVDPDTLRGFILSTGYAGYSLYLHPDRQMNSDFRYLGRETKGSRAHVMAFAQKLGPGDYLARYIAQNPRASVRYLVQGFVWIDPVNYQILRMYTRLLSPENLTDLEDTSTNIVYGKVAIENSRQEFWLPQEIQVEWIFRDYLYVTRHKYSDYHLFTVQSDYKIDQPRPDK